MHKIPHVDISHTWLLNLVQIKDTTLLGYVKELSYLKFVILTKGIKNKIKIKQCRLYVHVSHVCILMNSLSTNRSLIAAGEVVYNK